MYLLVLHNCIHTCFSMCTYMHLGGWTWTLGYWPGCRREWLHPRFLKRQSCLNDPILVTVPDMETMHENSVIDAWISMKPVEINQSIGIHGFPVESPTSPVNQPSPGSQQDQLTMATMAAPSQVDRGMDLPQLDPQCLERVVRDGWVVRESWCWNDGMFNGECVWIMLNDGIFETGF